MLNTVQSYLNIRKKKPDDFEHFLLKIFSSQNIIPRKSCFYLNMSFVCSLHAFFAFICKYTATVIDIFYITDLTKIV